MRKEADREGLRRTLGVAVSIGLVAAILLAVPPAVASSAADPYIEDNVVDMIRTYNESTELYDYKFKYYVCNDDPYSAFDGNVWWSFKVWNDGSTSNTASQADTSFHLHLSIKGSGQGECTNTNNTVKISVATAYKCGSAKINLEVETLDTDLDNNEQNDNSPEPMFSDGEFKSIQGAVLNWGGSSADFVNEIDAATVPEDWTVTIDSSNHDITVGPGEVGYFLINVTAPDPIIGDPPEIWVWSTVVGDASLRQSTHIIALVS